MTIVLNGQDHDAPEGVTVVALIESIGRGPGQVAVEVNGRIVPHAEFRRRILAGGDRVEVVQFVGGG